MQLNFPREVGAPRKIVYDKEEYLNYINLYNGKKKSIYCSIYSFDDVYYKIDYNSAVVNCLFFDFDDKECDSYNEVKKLHEYCFKENIKHKLVMSGRGYHCYVVTKPHRPNFVRDTIYNGQYFFIRKLNLKMDTHVIGNPAQLSRVVNTWNGKANRFCIPLTKEQFEKGDKFIKELASKQQFLENEFICNNYFDLDEFDFEVNSFDGVNEMNEVTIDLNGVKIKFPNCLSNIIKKGEMKWKERYLIILYLKESGYSQKNVLDVLTSICPENKLNHCIKNEKQLQYLFSRDDLLFPTCNKINMDGYCTGKCSLYNKLIYK